MKAHEALAVGVRQLWEQQRFADTEDRGCCANPQGQDQDQRRRKRKFPSDVAKGSADIMDQSVH